MTTRPSTGTLNPPGVDRPSVGHYFVFGLTSRSRASKWWTVDSDPAMFIGETTGDIYTDASDLTQIKSDIYRHKVDGKVTQFFGEVDRKVENNETVYIAGSNKIHCNSNQIVDIVGNHELTTAASQTSVIGSGQEITVKSGGRVLSVAGNLTETITGDHKVTVTGDDLITVNGQRVENSNSTSECKIFGPLCTIKASKENLFTASLKIATSYANEKAITVAAVEKAALSVDVERVSGKKETLNIGGKSSNAYGHRYEKKVAETMVAKAVSKIKGGVRTIRAKLIKKDYKVEKTSSSQRETKS